MQSNKVNRSVAELDFRVEGGRMRDEGGEGWQRCERKGEGEKLLGTKATVHLILVATVFNFVNMSTNVK